MSMRMHRVNRTAILSRQLFPNFAVFIFVGILAADSPCQASMNLTFINYSI